MSETMENGVKRPGFFYFVILFAVAAVVTVAGIFGGFQLGLSIGGRVAWFLLAVLGGFGGMVAVIWYSVSDTGRFQAGHVAVSFILAFATIITANMLLATNAVRTFPGLEVKNSYVASQTFDERREAQEALGWTIDAHHAGGLLTLSITDTEGRPVEAAALEATVGRATHVAEDVRPDFRFDGSAYVAEVPLGDGNWNIRLDATAEDGTAFTQRVVLVKE